MFFYSSESSEQWGNHEELEPAWPPHQLQHHVGGIQALALPSAPSTIPLTASCAEAACSANPGKEKEEKKTNEEGKEDEDGGRRKRFQLYA